MENFILFLDFLQKYAQALGLISIVLSAITVYIQYQKYKKETRLNILSQLNKEYTSNESIRDVVKELTKGNLIDDAYKKEMFLRFFENIQYHIDAGVLKIEIAYDLFSYYALQAYEKKESFYVELTHNDNSWATFERFIKTMKQYECNKNNNCIVYRCIKFITKPFCSRI